MATDQKTEQERLAAENERLRARLAALEAELVEVQERTNRVVAEAQEKAYWLERWHLDLNALMERPGAAEFRGLVRIVRAVYRRALNFKRNHLNKYLGR